MDSRTRSTWQQCRSGPALQSQPNQSTPSHPLCLAHPSFLRFGVFPLLFGLPCDCPYPLRWADGPFSVLSDTPQLRAAGHPSGYPAAEKVRQAKDSTNPTTTLPQASTLFAQHHPHTEQEPEPAGKQDRRPYTQQVSAVFPPRVWILVWYRGK